MMMLATGRRLAYCDSELREGRWHSNTFRSSARQLFGSTVGIIGFGRIGKIGLTESTGFDIFFKLRDCVKFIHDSISIKGETK